MGSETARERGGIESEVTAGSAAVLKPVQNRIQESKDADADIVAGESAVFMFPCVRGRTAGRVFLMD